jgi:dihydroorotate dehydrogenase (fumarate)
MIDLTTKYLGMTLKNPLVVSASPLSADVGNIRRMEDSGASAVVLPSLFEEQIQVESNTLDHFLWQGTESFAESLTYMPNMAGYNLGPDGYLEHLRTRQASREDPHHRQPERNFHQRLGGVRQEDRGSRRRCPGAEHLFHSHRRRDERRPGRANVRRPGLTGESQYHIPVAVKIGPYFSSLPNTAKRLDQAGANALVLFNRFYQPDFDLENLEVVPNLILSTPHELLLRLNWVAVLYGKIKADMAITGGVHSGLDVLKSMMAGASVAMMTSALLKNGIGHLATVQTELLKWMEEHEYESIHQMRGSMSQRAVADPSAFQRANYVKVLSSYALKAGAA